MSKDGTNRGGRRVRAGGKPDALADKITKGRAAKVLEVADLGITTTKGLALGAFCTIDILNCPDVKITAKQGVWSVNGGTTITNSNIQISASRYGILSGLEGGSGGDIVINNSNVDVSCNEEDDEAATIFAGDNQLR